MRRIGGTAAREALDRLVEHAPDDTARAAVGALIDEHVLLPEGNFGRDIDGVHQL